MSKCVKNIAVYLPQFYETEYNNEWWGEGFTDWVTVKKAVSLFDNHIQPKIPLNNNYYDTTKVDTLKYQSILMKEYGVDGLCFYHYFFKDGKKVLEKPAELLLENKDVDIPFCFNWATENWIRTWSNIQGNVWGEKYDKDLEVKGSGILLEQQFGEEAEWKAHFEYLLPFFKDERYIKIDNKPVFLFYNANQMRCLENMTRYWKELAVKNGLDGLFVIAMGINYTNENIDAIMYEQPSRAFSHLNKKNLRMVKNGVTCYKYVDFVEEIIDERQIGSCKTFFCGVPGYDTTPRRGNNADCIIERSPELFEVMLDALYRKSVSVGSEYVFINAWNEWGEGMYLEPDEESGYSYLEVIKRVSDRYRNIEINNYLEPVDNSEIKKQITDLKFFADRESYISINAVKLLDVIQSGHNRLKEYLETEGINTIAIYGIGKLGKLLFNQLRIEGVTIQYTIDQYTAQIQEICKMYRPDEAFPDVDLMVITSYNFEEIKIKMKKKGISNIVSIEKFLDDIISSIR
ncbi:MAG: glycoside hydrolase family 99-like domain-containing protein [Lachnospira sp.]